MNLVWPKVCGHAYVPILKSHVGTGSGLVDLAKGTYNATTFKVKLQTSYQQF